MANDPVQVRIHKRKKEINLKDTFTNLLYLILPLTILCGVLVTIISFSVLLFPTLFFVVFICIGLLPMFYTADKRLRNQINDNKKKFSYADGYKEFYSLKQKGIFGLIITILYAAMIMTLFYLLLANAFYLFCTPFPGSSDAFNNIVNLISTNGLRGDITSIIENEFYLIVKPFIILVSSVSFIPLFFVIFYAINNNLTNHYLATIVLPDIDLNFSASQSRSMAKTTVRKYLNFDILKYRLKNNWIYYLIFTLLYVGSVAILLSINYTSSTSVFSLPIFIMLVPILAVFYGFILNYFALTNEYIIVLELSSKLQTVLPEQIVLSLQNVFENKMYVHGEEYEKNGSFFLERKELFNANVTTEESLEDFYNKSFNGEIKENKNDDLKDNEDIGIQSTILDFSNNSSNKDNKKQTTNKDNKKETSTKKITNKKTTTRKTNSKSNTNKKKKED